MSKAGNDMNDAISVYEMHQAECERLIDEAKAIGVDVPEGGE